MRKLVTCPKCGRANPQKRVTCSSCKTDLPMASDPVAPKVEQAKMVACPACGDVGEAGMKLCPKCGFQLAVGSSNLQAKQVVSRQGFSNQPVSAIYSEEVTETIADSRYEAEKRNPVTRYEIFRNLAIVVILLAVLFYYVRGCVDLT